jgi:hypothetical protein
VIDRNAAFDGATGGLDLLLVVDTTGSMETYLSEIRRQIFGMISEMRAHVSDVRWGVVAFKDHGAEGEDDTYLTQTLPFTSALGALAAFMSSPKLAPGLGGGGAEAVECALKAANEFSWRPGARKVLVLVGDKPPHGAGLDGFGCCPDRVDYRDEVERLAERDVAIYSILVGDCLETRRVFEYFSARTQGKFLDLCHARDLPSSIVSVCHREAGSLASYGRRQEQAGRMTATRRILLRALVA